ncbi:hypothetical protein EUTSA_v10003474mg [Eutrema salsugineum]|uniref:Secreted protein n=1 Tax=Eutrema salsugineum TaxID=72664 RepID=V4LQ16_EUTSA|nr:hypothetical protein EUTSA_v10003474mg [Eutrema salsugineum]
MVLTLYILTWASAFPAAITTQSCKLLCHRSYTTVRPSRIDPDLSFGVSSSTGVHASALSSLHQAQFNLKDVP